MMKINRLLITLLATSVSLIPGSPGAEVAEAASLSPRSVVEPLQEVPFHKGVNMNAWFDRPDYQVETEKYNSQDIDFLKNLGMDVVRLPINLHSNVGPAPNYKISESYLQKLDDVVNSITSRNLWVILDQHSLSMVSFPTYGEALLTSCFQQLATRYKGKARIALELFNEPSNEITDWPEIQGRIIKAVREIDTDVIIIATNIGKAEELLNLPEYDDPRVIYTFHYYAPIMFTHQGAYWDTLLGYLSGYPFPYDSSRMPEIHKQWNNTTYLINLYNNYKEDATVEQIRKDITSYADWAEQNGRLLFCGEFGVLNTAQPEDRYKWYKAVGDILAEKNIPWTLWQYKDDQLTNFSIFTGAQIFDQLDTDMMEAVGVTLPSEFADGPHPLTIYSDSVEPWCNMRTDKNGGTDYLDYYCTDNPAEGTNCIRYNVNNPTGGVWFEMWLPANVRKLQKAGASLEFMARTIDRFNSLEFFFQHYKDGASRQWRMAATISSSGNGSALCQLTPDGEWHKISIPLNRMYYHGCDGEWKDSPGAGDDSFDWSSLNWLMITPDGDSDATGKTIYIDDIRIVQTPIECPDNMYIVGDAAPGGWATRTALHKAGDYIYEYKGQLLGGKSFKFYTSSTANADDLYSRVNAATADEALSTSGFENRTFLFPGTTDNNWKVAADAGGFYKLTLNMLDKTLTAEYCGDKIQAVLPFGDIWISGSATNPDGKWEFDYAKKLEKKEQNVYQYIGNLYSGAFRFFDILDFNSQSFKPAGTSSVNVTRSGFGNGDVAYCQQPDISWNVTEEGKYRITLDLNSITVKQEKITPDPGIYVIGAGLPNSTGWDTRTPIGLTKISDNIYKYIGHLDADASIKFLLKKAAKNASNEELLAGPFIKAPSKDYPITKTDMKNVEFLYNPSSDYNFKVNDAGYYELTLDIDAFTISSHYLGESFSSMCSLIDNIYIYGPAANSKKSWALSDAAAIKKIDDTHYQYMGHLNGGGNSYPQFRFMNVKDFDALSLKPANKDGAVLVTKNGMSETGVDYRLNPDKNWNVQDDGYYTLNLDLQNMTISAIDYMAELPTSATAVIDGTTSDYYATFSNIYSDMELSVENGSITVYNVTVDGDKIVLTERIGNCKVAHGEGVLVKASTSAIKVTPIYDDALTAATYPNETLLVATPVTASSVTSTNGDKLYRLTYNSVSSQSGLGFYYGNAEGTFIKTEPNKAYLRVPANLDENIRCFVINPNPSHVEEIDTEEQNANKPIYDIIGRRVENPTKGLYLQGNKKVIIR